MPDLSLRQMLLTGPVFRALDPATLDAVTAVAQQADIPPGGTILAEGDQDSDLVLLVSGDAHALRKTADNTDIELNDIHQGDCIGEMAFLDGSPRAASIKARSACTIVRIQTDALTDAHAIAALKSTLAILAVKRARLLSDEMMKNMQAKLQAQELQNQFGYFLIFTIAIFIISTSLFYLVAENYVEDVYDPGFSWQTVLLFAVPCLFIIRVLKIPLQDLGIKREGTWRAVWQAVAFCSIITLPAVIYLVFFKEPVAPDDRPVQITTVFLLQYLIHTAFQEVGARGLIQGLFVKFLNDVKGHRAVFLSSTIFASLHVTLGLDAVLLTFFAGIIFGYAYHYQKNLAGVIIIHYWFGVLAAILVAI